MIQIERFTFNTFGVNTYVLYDETREAVIVDAACYEPFEQQGLFDFIKDAGLKIVRNINTHCHIDHILGNQYVFEKYGIRPEYHKAGLPFFEQAKDIGLNFGYTLDEVPDATAFFGDNDEIRFGKSSLRVLYTPGHADGSVCFYCSADGFVITGDVLFRDTVGRTDLPSGDFDKLMDSIKTKLFTLPEDTVVYPGHGPETSIGYEMVNNPFIK
jgi:glyoxylase-like metal-dependent hydrolase (beta-lactamase superfamily II)